MSKCILCLLQLLLQQPPLALLLVAMLLKTVAVRVPWSAALWC